MILVAPFDTLKTLLQMSGSEKYQKQSLASNLSRVVRESGLKGLYSGSQSKFMQFFL